MANLFRPEVLSNRQRDWLGNIQLIRPVSLSLLTGFVALVVVAAGLFLTLGEYTRKARVNGNLASAPPGQGAGVAAGLQAHLFVPAGAIGAVRTEQIVQLRYQAFPHQTFGQQSGAVTQVLHVPALAAELAALPTALGAGEPMYRVVVALDPQTVPAFAAAQPLVAGMRVEADVALERHRLIEWLFAPLLGAAGRM